MEDLENTDEALEQLDAEALGAEGAEIATAEALEPGSQPRPRSFPASGLYEWRHRGGGHPWLSGVPGIRPVRSEELRLDVDRHYPQMTASGTVHGVLATQVHWIASLTATGATSWTGTIWYKDGAVVSFPYTTVEIKVVPSGLPSNRKATVTYSGGGAKKRVQVFSFKSRYFRPVNFEFDWAQGEAASSTVDTCAHPNRPAALPCETLSIETVFRRAGFAVTANVGGEVPISGAGPGARWSDQEMHDAMQVFWTRFAAAEQWAMWVFFASLHESGTSLGGIMFDDIGPNHRQGTALFVDSFIAQAPTGDANPAAWVERMRFWTACHEMGHAFNLAHSWQKSLGAGWIPLADEPEARSFMNYPYRVTGGQTAFFADFEYRFSDPELLFMRHAPARFVQMGNADWFDHHGFEEANVRSEPTFRLEVRLTRETSVFEFMEPVILELKLTNATDRPQLVDRGVLRVEALTAVVKRAGRPARQLVPFAQRCIADDVAVLNPGESIYEPLFASVGLNGWDIAEPGTYSVQVAAHLGDEDVVSNVLSIRVSGPASREEEQLADEYFTEEPGRILALRGSRVLDRGNAVLQEIAERIPDSRVALHARYALGFVLAEPYKRLVVDEARRERRLAFDLAESRQDEARELVGTALTSRPEVAADSFGHVVFRRRVERFTDWLAHAGNEDDAARFADVLFDTLSRRRVGGRPVLPKVLEEIDAKRQALTARAEVSP